MKTRVITLDVREDIRAGRQPFARIMGAIGQLKSDESLLLVAPFEPAPLFHLLQSQGFSHAARQVDSGDWEVMFTRSSNVGSAVNAGVNSQPATPATRNSANCVPTELEIVELDARGLEPPQPMVRILETLATLPGGAAMKARTDRRPMHLYPELERRGFSGRTEEFSDGSFITHIQRR